MTVREVIERLKQVRNQDAHVAVSTQLSTDTIDCIVSQIDDSRAEFGKDSDGLVWLKWPGTKLGD